MPDAMQVSDPAPAPMMGVAPFRADFPGATQQQPGGGALVSPSGDVQTFNEPQPGPGGLKASDLKSAMEAVQAAMRFQGARGFSEELQRGTPPEQALLKHGDKMFYNAPAAFASALGRLKNSQADTGPIMGVPVIDPATQQAIPGVTAVRGQGGAMHSFVDKGNTEEKSLAREARRFKASQLKSQIKDAETALSSIPAASPRRAEAEATLAKLKEGADALYKPAVPESDKAEHRKAGQELVKKHPTKAEAIRKRFKDTYNEDL